MKVYTVFDRVAEEAGPLYEAINDGIALRNFRGVMEKIPPYQHGDYRLYCIAEYDNKTMAVIGNEPREVLFSEELGS